MANYKCIRSFKSSNITTNRNYYYGNTIGHSEYQRLAYYEQANFQKVHDEDTTTGYSGLSSTSADLELVQVLLLYGIVALMIVVLTIVLPVTSETLAGVIPGEVEQVVIGK